MHFDLSKGFPAITTKKLAWKSVVSELLWFLEGSTDERRLAEIHFGKSRKEIVDKKTIQKKMEERLSELQKEVWGYQSELETHTVETHIHRLRKKIKEKFNDNNLIVSTKDGYQIN